MTGKSAFHHRGQAFLLTPRLLVGLGFLGGWQPIGSGVWLAAKLPQSGRGAGGIPQSDRHGSVEVGSWKWSPASGHKSELASDE